MKPLQKLALEKALEDLEKINTYPVYGNTSDIILRHQIDDIARKNILLSIDKECKECIEKHLERAKQIINAVLEDK